MAKFTDLTGRLFGRLLVINRVRDKIGVYYLCRCNCGNEKIVRASHLVSNKIQSCRCLNAEKTAKVNRYKSGEANFNLLYNTYIQNAKKRKLIFSISKEDFKGIVARNCFYCGTAPTNSTNHQRTFGAFLSNGVDRVNNNIGYETGNCVPCCTTCNKAKLTMSKEEFFRWIKRVYVHSNLDLRQ